MPRPPRQIVADAYYHVLNRGNGRMTLFHKPEDFLAFKQVLKEGLERYPVDLLCYCLMSNHWHLVPLPRKTAALADLMRWIGVTHVRRHHEHYHSRGGGHLYQGRFKSFPIQENEHFLTVCRYVEANPSRAKMVDRAEVWEHGSLSQRKNEAKDPSGDLTLAEWPVERPGNWVTLVNREPSAKQLAAVRLSVMKGRPFGDEGWVAKTAKRLGLTNTLRSPGRPRGSKSAPKRATGKSCRTNRIFFPAIFQPTNQAATLKCRDRSALAERYVAGG